MISGSLSSPVAHWLGEQNPALKQALTWLSGIPANAPEGITFLGQPGFYANIHSYRTRERSHCVWESHRQTVDVQVCLEGQESVDWTEPQFLTSPGTYQEEGDREEWASAQQVSVSVILRPGSFVIFLAGEPHLPMVANGEPGLMRKVVAKIPAVLLG